MFRFNTRLRSCHFTMGKRKRNERPPRPRKEGPARTSSSIAAAGTGGGARTPVASSAGIQDPRPGKGKAWGDTNGPSRARTRGGGKPTPPNGQEGGGAANRHAPKITITISNPVSAALAHGFIDASTTGQRGCLGGDLGAGALRMARRGSYA